MKCNQLSPYLYGMGIISDPDAFFMDEALKMAEKALLEDEVTVGACIVAGQQIIAKVHIGNDNPGSHGYTPIRLRNGISVYCIPKFDRLSIYVQNSEISIQKSLTLISYTAFSTCCCIDSLFRSVFLRAPRCSGVRSFLALSAKPE